jgi:ribosomal protein L37E
MKSFQQITRCKRCGELLSSHEKSHADRAGLCAICDHMRSEALEIYRAVQEKNNGEKIRFRLV